MLQILTPKQRICQRRSLRRGFRDVFILTVTGESTLWTLLSSTNISLAFAHNALTSDSLIISHLLSCSICLSRSLVSHILLKNSHRSCQTVNGHEVDAYYILSTSRHIEDTGPIQQHRIIILLCQLSTSPKSLEPHKIFHNKHTLSGLSATSSVVNNSKMAADVGNVTWPDHPVRIQTKQMKQWKCLSN